MTRRNKRVLLVLVLISTIIIFSQTGFSRVGLGLQLNDLNLTTVLSLKFGLIGAKVETTFGGGNEGGSLRFNSYQFLALGYLPLKSFGLQPYLGLGQKSLMTELSSSLIALIGTEYNSDSLPISVNVGIHYLFSDDTEDQMDNFGFRIGARFVFSPVEWLLGS